MTAWMDPDDIVLSEKREKQIPYDFTSIIQRLKNRQNRNRLIQTKNRWLPCGGGVLGKMGEGDKEVQTSSYKLVTN